MAVNDISGVSQLWAKSIDVHGCLWVTTANMTDSIGIRNARVDGTLSVTSQGGYDALSVAAIADQLAIYAGAGSDSVQVLSTKTNVLKVTLGTGADKLDLTDAVANQIFTYGGEDDDLFRVRNTQAIDAVFNGGLGLDTYQDFNLQPNQISQLKRSVIERVQRI